MACSSMRRPRRTPPPAEVSGPPEDLAKAADALGKLVRSGVDPKDAAARVGVVGLKFTGQVPVSLRSPEDK